MSRSVLITAGPTREHIDPVRFLTNPASGRLGTCLAREARRRGDEVILILGPSEVTPPEEVDVRHVVSAEEMRSEVLEEFDRIDVLVMSAAVCDLRPEVSHPQKQRKEDLVGSVSLEATPDILREAGRRKTDQFLLGFAVGGRDSLDRLLEKRDRKRLDLIVGNPPEAMGDQEQEAILVDGDGIHARLPRMPKSELAALLIDEIERRLENEV